MLLRRVAAVAVVVAAVALAGGAWYRTLTCAPATGPRHLTWHKADGTPPTDPPGDAYPFDGCSGDMNFNLAAWSGGVILPCDDEAIGAGWAFLDPRTGQAALRWPASTGGKEPITIGLVPGPDHQLAIVFEAPLQGDLYVGIARPDGWARPPEDLGARVYRAGAWVGGRFELVANRVGEHDEFGLMSATEVIALDGAARRERIALPACASPCVMPEIVYRAAGRWVFERDGGAVVEGGGQVPAAFDEPYFHAQIDRVAHGVLSVPATLALGEDTPVLDADGKPAHPPPPPWAGLVTTRSTRYRIDGAIHRLPLWASDRSYRGLVEQVADRSITWHSDEDDRVRITDARLRPGELPHVAPVVRWRQGLATRMIIPDDATGYWVIDGSGAYIHLDHALHRTDPLPLREHLRQRGSLGRHIDEPEHERMLGWVLFGLPLLLAGGVAIGWLAAGRSRVLARPVVVAALVYLATAAWALVHVAPLL
ncbi:MAG TPA: hypothetical protein VFK02_07825 [Kofleriaceae bacterium]|nr:hypothetical protein [Kofleriaceae bacterium]